MLIDSELYFYRDQTETHHFLMHVLKGTYAKEMP